MAKTQAKVHIVLDVETTALTPAKGAIWQLGAVAVIQHSGGGASVMLPDRHGFEYTVKPHTVGTGRYDRDTVVWQFRENEVNWTEASKNGKNYSELLKEGLWRFGEWGYSATQRGTDKDDYLIWTQGTDFDIPFLAATYEEADILPPWKYNQVRDLRTLRNLFPSVPEPTNSNPHNALADAYHQAQCLANIFNYLTELGVPYDGYNPPTTPAT